MGFSGKIRLKVKKNDNSLSFDFKKSDDGNIVNFTDTTGSVTILGEIKIDNLSKLRQDFDGHKLKPEELISMLYIDEGENFVSHLEGEYAFCLIDKKKSIVRLYRDKYGIIPLFFAYESNAVLFSTHIGVLEKELKFISINKKSVVRYLNIQEQENEETFFNEINRILPNEHYCFSKNGIIGRSKTTIATRGTRKDKSLDIALSLRQKLVQSTNSKLGSNEKVGLMLSGGLDSSCIASSLADNYKIKVLTYSLSFDHLVTGDSQIDETNYQDLINTKFSFVGNSYQPKDTKTLEISRKNLGLFGQPFYMPNLYMFEWVYSEAKRDNLDIVFDGHDGDTVISHGHEYIKELFFSFRWFKIYSLLKDYALVNKQTLFDTFKKIIRRALKETLYILPINSLRNRRSDRVISSFPYQSQYKMSFFASHQKKLSNPLLGISNEYGYFISRKYNVRRASPFFADQVVEFCIKIDSSFKFSKGYTRKVLRDAFKKDLPKEILNRPGKANLGSFLLNQIQEDELKDLAENIEKIDKRLIIFVNKEILLKEFSLLRSENRDERSFLNLLSFYLVNNWLKDRQFLEIK